VLPLTESTTELDLPIDPGLRGGAFITATVIREINPEEHNWLPHRAMGTVRLRTDHSQHDLPLAIAAPSEARPGQTISARVQTSSPTTPLNPPMIHLWAVDEGILLASAYATPHPADYFFAPREVGVTSADVFDDLMPDYRRPADMARIGGDGSDEGLERRLASVPMPRRAPAVVWRAAVPAALGCPRSLHHSRLAALGGLPGAGRASPVVSAAPPAAGPRFTIRRAAPDDVYREDQEPEYGDGKLKMQRCS
jgi:uncharacterized protein YfaS (alpha-2-macroglobulin family)